MSSPGEGVRALWLTSILLFATLIIPIPFAGAVSAGNVPLEDGERYWQGQLAAAGNVANSNEVLSIVDQNTGTTEKTVTADNTGGVEINTTDLGGAYFLNDSSGSTILSFTVIIHSIDTAAYKGINVRYAGNAWHVVLEVESNRGSYEVELSSVELNLSVRGVDGTQTDDGLIVVATDDTEFEFNVSDTRTGNFTVEGSVTDSTAQFSVTFDIANPPSYSYVLADKHPTPTVDLEDGTEYWQGKQLRHQYDQANAVYEVHTDGGTFVRQISTNETGHRSIDTGSLAGGGYIVRNDSGATIITFEVREQDVSASLEKTALTVGESTTATLSTNRNGTDVAIWMVELNRSQLQSVVPAATREHGDLILKNVSDGEAFEVETDEIKASTYTLRFLTTEAEKVANVSFDVEAPETDDGGTPESSTSDTSSSGVDSLTPTRTETPSPASTVVLTASPTPLPTQPPVTVQSTAAIPTPTSTATTSPPTASPTARVETPTTEAVDTTANAVEQTQAPGQPGFGFPITVMVLLVLIILRRRE